MMNLGLHARLSAATPVLWFLAMAFVAGGELLPGTAAPMRWISNDKLLHFGAYTCLAAIPSFGFARRKGIWSALSMILVGIALEFVQRLIPGRSFEVFDMLANTLGVFTGIVIGAWSRALLLS